MNNGLIYRPRSLSFEHSMMYGHLPQSGANRSGADLYANLVAWWKLDETSGSRINSVSLGYGTLSPVGTPTSVTGIIANGAQNTGNILSGFKAVYDANFDFSGKDLSFSMWLNIPVNTVHTLFRKVSDNGAVQDFSIYLNDTTFQVASYTGAPTIPDNTTTGTISPPTGVWFHFAFTFTLATKTFRYYINGVLSGTLVTAGNIGNDVTAHLFVGSESNATPCTFAFSYDEVAIWTGRVLTLTEILSLYNGGNGVTY